MTDNGLAPVMCHSTKLLHDKYLVVFSHVLKSVTFTETEHSSLINHVKVATPSIRVLILKKMTMISLGMYIYS